MTFDEYQRESKKTAQYPDVGNNITIPLIGLCGETGEVAEKVKKVLFYEDQTLDETKRNEFKKELGDVLWYLTQLATELKVSMEDVAEANLEKTRERERKGTLIQGVGDNR